jgi:ABC-2 type transport system ATP-binding protein
LISLRKAEVSSGGGGMVRSDQRTEIDLVLESDREYRAWVYLGISEGTASPIFVLNPGRETQLAVGQTNFRCTIERLPLPLGSFYVWVGVYDKWTDGEELLGWQPVAKFDVYGPELDRAPRAVVRLAPLYVDAKWQIQRN